MKYLILSITFLFFASCTVKDDTKALQQIKLGNEFMDAKNYSSALPCFKKALQYELTPETKSKNYRNLAVVYLYMKEADSAKLYSELGIDCSPKDSYYHLINLAEYHLLSDSIELALEIFEKAKKMKPKDVTVYNNLSLIYAGSYGEDFLDLKKALKNAKMAFEISNNSINQEQLASVHFQLESYDKAANLFHDLYERFPAIKVYSFFEGQCLYFAGEEEKGYSLMLEAANRDAESKKLLEEISS